MKKNKYIIVTSILILICSFYIVNINKKPKIINSINNLSLKDRNSYSFFSFINPIANEGYIFNHSFNSTKQKKYTITDKQFSPSDAYFFNNKYYFASGAYARNSNILSYDINTKSFKTIETNQENYIERFYMDDKGMYITTVSDMNGCNLLYDINNNKSVSSGKDEFILDITSLDNTIIAISLNNTTGNCRLIKYDRNLNFLKDTNINSSISFYPYFATNDYLYLFSTFSNGEIYQIDSNLNITVLKPKLNISFDPNSFNYGKVVSVGNNKVLCEYFYTNSQNDKSGLIEYEFTDNTLKSKTLNINSKEKLINSNYKENEVYTRESKDSKIIIKVRNLSNYDIIKVFELDNKDLIYFVDKLN